MAGSPQDARTQDQRTGTTGAAGTADTSTFSAAFASLADSADDTVSTSGGGQGSGVMTSSVSFPAYVARETASPHPYMLRPGLSGKYYIYLPKGCLVVNGEVIDVEGKFKGVSKNESVLKYPWYQYPASVTNGGTAVAQFMNVTLEWDKNNEEYTVKSVEFTSGSAKESGSGSGSGSGESKTKVVSVAISRPNGQRPAPVVTSSVFLTVEAPTYYDDESINVTDESDDTESDGVGALQLKNFDNEESDETTGLVSYLSASIDESTNEVTLSANGGDSLMLVARSGTSLVYLPLADKSDGGDGDDSGDSGDSGTDAEDPTEEVPVPDDEDTDPVTPGKDSDGEKDSSSPHGGDKGGSSGGKGGSEDSGGGEDCGEGGVAVEDDDTGGGLSGGGYAGCSDC